MILLEKTSDAEKKLNKQPSTKAETPSKETRSQLIAKLSMNPAYRSASINQKFDWGENVDIWDLTREVRNRCAAIQSGNMEGAGEMLAAQAIALDGLFANLARCAGNNLEAGYGGASERYMKLALRAQAQCAKTILTMGELKNPRHIAFVQQANIAQNQQVNNGQAPRAGNNEFQQNKLIEGASHDLSMDNGTAQAAGEANQKMEAVGAINRPDNG